MSRRGRYDSLRKSDDPKSLQEFAAKYGLSNDEVNKAAQTLRAINSNLNEGPNIDEEFAKKYKRVYVGKLLVPRSFYKHCQLVCELMDIKEEAFWQMIMMEAMASYADKAENVIRMTNNTLRREMGAEPNTDDQPESSAESSLV